MLESFALLTTSLRGRLLGILFAIVLASNKEVSVTRRYLQSPPHQPPPRPPPAGPSGTSGSPGASGSSQQNWWKPLEEDRTATLELAWSIPSSDLPIPMNNWASALVSTCTPPPEDSLLAQTGPAFELVKVFHPNVIHFHYQMEECHKLLTDSVDESIIRHNVSKPLPLGGPPGQVTIQSDFFFNKHLEYLRYDSKGSRPALSISKMKAAYYPDVGLEQTVPDQMWIEEECKHTSEGDRRAVRTHMRILSVVIIEVFSMYGYDYMKKIVLRKADLNEHIIAKRDFTYLYPRQRVEDFQLGIESYQTQLNLTKPRWDATGFEYQHDFTIDEALDYRVKEFKVNRMNPGLNTRFLTRKDVDRSKEFMFAIHKRLKTRRIFRNLESFVGGRVAACSSLRSLKPKCTIESKARRSSKNLIRKLFHYACFFTYCENIGSGTESGKQDTSSRSGNDIDTDDADIRPIYDEEPMVEVQLTVECNIFATRQQHTEQPEFSIEGGVDQFTKKMNSSKNMPRFSSNDMVHNHYLEEAKKNTQERDRNSTSRVMYSARLQNTTNEVNSRAKIQSHKTRNSNKPIDQKSHTQKPGSEDGNPARANVKQALVGSPFFWQWEHPPLAVGNYTASGNSLLAVGMPCAFYSQQLVITGYRFGLASTAVKPCQGDSLNLPDYRYKRWCCSLFQLSRIHYHKAQVHVIILFCNSDNHELPQFHQISSKLNKIGEIVSLMKKRRLGAFKTSLSVSLGVDPFRVRRRHSSRRGRIILGLMVIVQATKLRRTTDIREGGHKYVVPIHDYIRKVIEEASKDDHFIRDAWVSAVEYLNVEGGITSGCFGDMKTFCKNGKLEKIVVVIKSCTSNVLGELTIPFEFEGRHSSRRGRIILDLMGIVQATKLRRTTDIREGGHKYVVPIHDYIRKVIEEASKDDHFMRDAWVSAVEYLNAEGGITSGCFGDMKTFCKNGKLENIVVVIKSCTSNVLDMTSSIPATTSYSGTFRISTSVSPPTRLHTRRVVIAKAEPSDKSVEIMRKFSEQYARKSDTFFCVDKSVTSVVIKGLADHRDSLGAPLCPCRHYDDKEAEAKQGFWNCPCVPMRERKECHCMLFLTPDNDFAGDEQAISLEEIKELTANM
nr:ferredoxin-thioredoxin reductase catalytic chain, chloroplastic [Tanacetum cinerariifolium]